jgi:hypothetical protein
MSIYFGKKNLRTNLGTDEASSLLDLPGGTNEDYGVFPVATLSHIIFPIPRHVYPGLVFWLTARGGMWNLHSSRM